MGLLLVVPGSLFADPPPIDESSLFGATVLREIDQATVASGTVALTPGAPAPPPPVTLVWGGSADATVMGQWKLESWQTPPPYEKGSAVANAIVYLDSRPNPTSRFYLETAVAQDVQQGTSYKVREMFLDTNLNQVLFRVGKQRIAWGVGTWFSPADVLSLESIDLTDTTKKREGPFAVKVDVPVGLHSVTMYTVLPQDGGVQGAALAPRVEFLWGSFEVAVAGYWRPNLSLRPRGMVLTTGAIGPFTVTGEGVVVWGSDRRWVGRTNTGALVLRSDETTVYPQGTVGLGWSWVNGEQDVSLDVQGQYYYDSTGYEDPSILVDGASSIKTLVNKGQLNATDLANPGRHYLAGNVTVGKLWNDTVKLGTTGWANLSDGSFRLSPSVTVAPLPLTSLRFQTAWEEGAIKGQYSPSGRMLTPSLRLSVADAVNAEVFFPWEATTGKTSFKATVGWTITGF